MKITLLYNNQILTDNITTDSSQKDFKPSKHTSHFFLARFISIYDAIIMLFDTIEIVFRYQRSPFETFFKNCNTFTKSPYSKNNSQTTC